MTTARMTASQEQSAPLARGHAEDAGGVSEAAHFVFVPLREQGHLIPAVDTALLLATHGAVCTIAATPTTAARVRATVDSARRSGLQVRLVEFPLDYAAAGLPDGADNADNIPGEHLRSYFDAVARLRAPIESYLRARAPFPTCVVSDFCHPWTTALAANLGVPRLSFFSMCALCLLGQHNVERFKAFEGVAGDDEAVVVPGLEKRVVVTRAQAPGFFRGSAAWEEFADYIERARAEADGVIVNTFEEMEPEYVAGYAAARKMKVWAVGPVSLYQQQRAATLAARGYATAAIDAGECLRWLDGTSPAPSSTSASGASLAAKARVAMQKGGSSHGNLLDLVERFKAVS